MYQHQHAPLPLDQLIDVAQPVVVLLEVLLEKDPKWRFQNPTELVNALPKVTGRSRHGVPSRIKACGRSPDQPLGASGKAEFLTNLTKFFAVRRLRPMLWAALVIGGGAILVLSFFLGPKSFTPQASRSLSPGKTAPEKSIAVLPFENLSGNKNDTYFADGVQDEILSNLAKVSELRVISRTSVMSYRAVGNRNLRTIAAALEVTRVLEGTVRRDGNRVRITTELIDAETDRTLWSESYDRDLTDIFAIQSEIAQTVVAKLRPRVSPEEERVMQQKPTENLAAYDLYLQAKASFTSLSLNFGESGQHFLDAIALLEQATHLDPTFALAYWPNR